MPMLLRGAGLALLIARAMLPHGASGAAKLRTRYSFCASSGRARCTR
jgi:hypothetical protein